jgi:1-deoxy-D-xylulose-5-phosphate synthase
MAPADENELQHMMKTALTLTGPSAIRYPRGAGVGVALDREFQTLPVGKAEVRKEGSDICILAIGNTVAPAMEAARLLAAGKIDAGEVNMRFLKPFDAQTVLSIASRVKNIAVIEENSVIGGLNSQVCETLAGKDARILQIGLPDIFIEHGHPSLLREKFCLTAEKIADRVKAHLGK